MGIAYFSRDDVDFLLCRGLLCSLHLVVAVFLFSIVGPPKAGGVITVVEELSVFVGLSFGCGACR